MMWHPTSKSLIFTYLCLYCYTSLVYLNYATGADGSVSRRLGAQQPSLLYEYHKT